MARGDTVIAVFAKLAEREPRLLNSLNKEIEKLDGCKAEIDAYLLEGLNRALYRAYELTQGES